VEIASGKCLLLPGDNIIPNNLTMPKRIIVLADRAVKQRKRQLAVAVFEAALSPGTHEGFLRQKYEQLKKGKWSPDPRR
jgi:hypothetical protein